MNFYKYIIYFPYILNVVIKIYQKGVEIEITFCVHFFQNSAEKIYPKFVFYHK